MHGWRLHEDIDHAFKLLSTLQFTSLQTINNSRVHNETFSPVSYYAPAKFSSAEIYSVRIQNARAAEFISRLRNRDIFSPVAGTARRVSSRQSLVPIVISQKTDNYERVLATTINTRQPFTCINQR